MKSIVLTLLIIASITCILNAQSINYYSSRYVEAKPKIGWDSIGSQIRVSEIARRGGGNRIYLAEISIDSTGSVVSINVSAFQNFIPIVDTLLIHNIKMAILSSEWLPAKYDGKKLISNLSVPFIFDLKGPFSASPVIIKTDRRIVEISY